jgi:hypothetical protein
MEGILKVAHIGNTNEEKLKFLMSQMVRNDLNLEKNPSIFSLAKGRGELKAKRIKWERKIDNATVECEIVVSPSVEHGNLTTEDQKVMYGLIKLWEKKGKPEEVVFSLRELAEELNMCWSEWVYKALKKSLLRLRFSAFTWSKAYFDGITKEYYDELDSFTILAELKMARNGKGKHITYQGCKVKFYPLIEKNLRGKYTQPSYYNVMIGFKSGLAQILYNYLELTMHDKNYYERNTEGLFFDDLDLEAVDYRYKSGRKRVLDVAIKELDGLPIPSGILCITLKETVDKQDYKIVVTKVNPPEMSAKETNNSVLESSNTKTEIPQSLNTKTTDFWQAGQLIELFIERFGLRRKATENELKKAKELINQHKLDLNKGSFFIDCAKREATTTSYEVKNFAGILQYLNKALDEYKNIQRSKQSETAIKNCSLCISGQIYVYQVDGKRSVMRCLHDVEKHRAIEEKDGVKIVSHK